MVVWEGRQGTRTDSHHGDLYVRRRKGTRRNAKRHRAWKHSGFECARSLPQTPAGTGAPRGARPLREISSSSLGTRYSTRPNRRERELSNLSFLLSSSLIITKPLLSRRCGLRHQTEKNTKKNKKKQRTSKSKRNKKKRTREMRFIISVLPNDSTLRQREAGVEDFSVKWEESDEDGRVHRRWEGRREWPPSKKIFEGEYRL